MHGCLPGRGSVSISFRGSVYLSVGLSVVPSVSRVVGLYICVSVWLCVGVSVCLSVGVSRMALSYLSVCQTIGVFVGPANCRSFGPHVFR